MTWTTYGTWLQGDERGYVKDGITLPGDKKLLETCKDFQKGDTVKLNRTDRNIIHGTILKEAKRIGCHIEALAVCSNHVHLVMLLFPESIGHTVSRFKNVTSAALRNNGRQGRIWTRGFDKRFCFNDNDLQTRIRYVNKHNI